MIIATQSSTVKPKLPNRYQRFARMALELASILDNNMTYQLCSLIVKRNRVLAVGYNSRKTSPMMQNSHMQMWHAESHAVSRCPQNELDGAEIIVARVRSSGKPGLARPCKICEDILRRYGIRRVFYTVNGNDSEQIEIEEMRL